MPARLVRGSCRPSPSRRSPYPGTRKCRLRPAVAGPCCVPLPARRVLANVANAHFHLPGRSRPVMPMVRAPRKPPARLLAPKRARRYARAANDCATTGRQKTAPLCSCVQRSNPTLSINRLAFCRLRTISISGVVSGVMLPMLCAMMGSTLTPLRTGYS